MSANYPACTSSIYDSTSIFASCLLYDWLGDYYMGSGTIGKTTNLFDENYAVAACRVK